MIENESISKKERMDFQPGRDKLSELPLSIIHIILALVPFKDAVRTSILSRQWRYTWASLPHLVFEDECASVDPKIVRKFEKCMKNSITHALFHCKGPIHKFKMSVPFQSCCPDIDEWILCLARNDVKELILDMGDYPELQQLRSSVYSCEKLTNLELRNCELDPAPTTFKAFLFLRSLCLREVFLSTNVIESLVSNCPILEEFTSIDCGSSELRISAPNLKVLHLQGCYFELSVYAPLLAELSVELKDDGFRFNRRQQNSSVCKYTNFIGGFTNLEKLQGDLYFTKYLSMGIESCHHTLVFHQLKDIELAYIEFDDIKVVSVVARLIAGALNLQKLEISNVVVINVEYDDESEVPLVSFSDFGCAPDFKLEKLRVVKMRHFTGLRYEMAFIKFLLECSPVLETMSFNELTSQQKQNLSARLQGCSRASPNAKLSLNEAE